MRYYGLTLVIFLDNYEGKSTPDDQVSVGARRPPRSVDGFRVAVVAATLAHGRAVARLGVLATRDLVALSGLEHVHPRRRRAPKDAVVATVLSQRIKMQREIVMCIMLETFLL